ncbi:uncharacterized protein LOC124163874 [Ischnura elegans]|uniref:uncharacterized protein LOC124163874 n=1 Tax=Ischnura elegans TaxID=197161 RepID=UPI001ED88138|nr:uncharacterized protein LOC124163874 [Ischnura elegans]
MSRNSTAPWTQEATNALIDNYSRHEHLFNSKAVNYHNKFLRTKSLNEILLCVEPFRPGTTVQDIKTKVNTLRSQFGAEEQRIKASMKSGCSADEVYVPTFRHYEQLLFLRGHMIPRKSAETRIALESPESTPGPSTSTGDARGEAVSVEVDMSTFEPLVGDYEVLQFHEGDISLDERPQSSISTACSIGTTEERVVTPMSDASSTSKARRGKRQREADTSKSAEVLEKIARTLDAPINPPESQESHFAKFLWHGLERIQSEERRLRTTKKLFDILLEAQLEDLLDRKN